MIRFKNRKLRDNAIKILTKRGVESHVYFPSIHLFPVYKQFGYKKGDFPISERMSETSLAIPFYSTMKNNDIEFITDCLKSTKHKNKIIK